MKRRKGSFFKLYTAIYDDNIIFFILLYLVGGVRFNRRREYVEY